MGALHLPSAGTDLVDLRGTTLPSCPIRPLPSGNRRLNASLPEVATKSRTVIATVGCQGSWSSGLRKVNQIGSHTPGLPTPAHGDGRWRRSRIGGGDLSSGPPTGGSTRCPPEGLGHPLVGVLVGFAEVAEARSAPIGRLGARYPSPKPLMV